MIEKAMKKETMKMHTVEAILVVEKNYSKCPLKKRPVNYQFEESAAQMDTLKMEPVTDALPKVLLFEEPQNLSLKKQQLTESCGDECLTTSSAPADDELINVSDCCEDEGVDVDHTDDDEDEHDHDHDHDHDYNDDDDEDDEMIDCVDIEENHGDAANTTQAAALAAAAAAAVAAASAAAVVVPTPTYPKYGLQPWNFHMSPYTAEFYRTINNPHLAQQISPLRGDLLSPSSPSDSIGSLSPPPHYLHGRASSVSPPMRSEIIHRPIGVRHLPQTPQHPHTHPHPHPHSYRFLPYTLPTAFHHHSHHHHTQLPTPLSATASATTTGTGTVSAYPLNYPHHHAPISPAYSESSFYSMRSLTPESSSSLLPEDLSVKQFAQLPSGESPVKREASAAHPQSHTAANSGNSASSTASAPSSPSLSSLSSLSSSSSSSTSSPTKKEKNAPPRYQCPDCQKSYSTFSGLTKHQQFHCPAAEGNQVKKSFSCKDCDKTYVSLGALKMHIRTHTLPCKCNICGKAFSRPWLLQGHIRTHTGEKPFSCQHCHRAFADRSNLRAHLQTHSDIKKYSCTNCSKTFSRMSLLTKHSEGGCSGGSGSSSGISSSSYSSAGTESSSPDESCSFPIHVPFTIKAEH